MDKKISVVIAAYNEGPRIGNMLKEITKSPIVNEIIVVNDGSQDNTAEVVSKFLDVKLITNKHNLGKTLSIKKGIKITKKDIVMLVDADLIGFDQKMVEKLAKPVLDGKVDWTLSIRDNSFNFVRVLKLTKVDWLSGERVIPKSLLADPLIWSRPELGYGLETLMNESLISRKKSFASIYLPGVKNPEKAEKDGFWPGVVKQFNMVIQISKILPPHKVALQYIKMIGLNKKYSQRIEKLS